MKRIVIAFLLMALAIAECGAQQTVENVIRRSRAKSALVRSGHYVMQQKYKYLSHPDTSTTIFTCDFKMVSTDTLFGKYFSLTNCYPGDTSRFLYTGKEMVVSFNDTTGTIISCDKWANVIEGWRHQLTFYTPLTEQSVSPFPSEENLADSNYFYSLSETVLNGRPCYLVDILCPVDSNEYMGIRSLRYEINLWIDKKDYRPLQYSKAVDILQQKDTMYQYEECKLLSFSSEVNESKFALSSIPASVTLSDYAPYNAPVPLAVGSQAPDWSLPSLDGDTVRLADLKGKVVLLDFFYKSCAPCCAALPKLQSLHEKYKDRGFVMIGIDPIDNPQKDKMSDFLSKRDITYTVLFSDRQLPQTYRVQGYPTLFFLDREGKIAKIHVGFSKDMEDAIEEQLLKMLE